MSILLGSPLLGECPGAILHVVGEATLYRPSNSTPTAFVVSRGFKLAMRRHEGFRPELAWYDQLVSDLEHGYLTRHRVPSYTRSAARALTAALEAMDDLSVAYARPEVEGVVRSLVEEGLLSVSGGECSLTPAGIVAAHDVRARYTTQNITNFWMSRTITAAYIGRLLAYLSQRCTRSAQFGELGELVNNYMASVIARDGFATRLREGRHPAFSDIKAWVYKAALSTFRDEGRDALTRSFKGARTEKDLHQAEDADVADRSMPTEARVIYETLDDDGQSGAMVSGGSSSQALLDAVGGDLEEEMIHRLSWQRGIERAEAVVRRAKAGAPDRFVRLLHHVVADDATFRDIGKHEGVSRNRAAALVSDLRNALQKERENVDLSFRVLSYVQENAYSTLADLEAPVDDDPDSSEGGLGETVPLALLQNLVAYGWLSCTNGCYVITQAGEAVLASGDYFGVDVDLNPLRTPAGSSPALRA